MAVRSSSFQSGNTDDNWSAPEVRASTELNFQGRSRRQMSPSAKRSLPSSRSARVPKP